jgi:hypothetical protein
MHHCGYGRVKDERKRKEKRETMAKVPRKREV